MRPMGWFLCVLICALIVVLGWALLYALFVYAGPIVRQGIG